MHPHFIVVIIFKSILSGSRSLTLMTFLLWMERPFRDNEKKQHRLAPGCGGDSVVMTNTWSRAVQCTAQSLAGYTASTFGAET